MRILLVEDEQKTGDYLKQGLSEAGYITDWVTDGLTGKHQALSEEYAFCFCRASSSNKNAP